ncbi:shikimate kinase [Flavobacterium aciduliphilum]|uniref:Shikimate kinase n=1 Tax=Flavobacterium aciduliphilum TaxID=1101402 RepID=A0A328YSG1_9FLAO|nr:shikimate kinase [Flavobacterium aciduliphilum]RAR75705.1 shikimate kinase [Flavobacterium aciduliphilum]
MKVVLVGYMGCGKSVVARELAKRMGMKSLELDEIIEKKCQMPLTKIFETKGELYFRTLEHEIFKQLLNEEADGIISTGGGTPCYFNNHEFLQQNGIYSIYLKAPVEVLYQRLKKEKTKRPMIAKIHEEDLKEFIAKHLFERSNYYTKAKFTIAIAAKSPAEIVDELLNLLA